MAISSGDNATVDGVERQLDQEIQLLQSQIKALRNRRAIQTTNILSARSSQAILARLRLSATASSGSPALSEPPNEASPLHQTVLSRSHKQLLHNQECLYRTCSGVTTFKVLDPDPFAVDKGNVLGIRIEAFAGEKFIRPYYVFLNKPYPGSKLLRVHRHTVPPCVPLAALTEKYLPTPAAVTGDVLKVRKQNLPRFVTALRKEIASYHNRVAAIAGMRKDLGLDVKEGREKGKGKGGVVRDVSAADAEARQIRFEWADGKIGRAVVGASGELLKCVVIGEEGRDKPLERKMLGGNGRIEGLAERLAS